MLQETDTRIRRVVLIMMVLLLIDLAGDHCLGQTFLVPPNSAAQTSLTSPPLCDSGKVDPTRYAAMRRIARICPA